MIKRKPRKLVWSSLSLFFLILHGCIENSKDIKGDFFSFSGSFHSVKNIKNRQFSGYYILNNADSMFYNIGFNISNLNEEIPTVVYVPDKKTFVFDANIDTTGIIFVDRKDFDIEKYRKQNINFEHKGSQIWKYTFPVDTSKGGNIGLYIDSIATGNLGVLQFNAFINSASKGNYSRLIQIIKTISLQDIRAYEYYRSTIYVN